MQRIGRGEKRYLIFARNGKRPLEKPRSRRKDDIKMYLKEVGYQSVNCIHPVQSGVYQRDLVNKVMDL
jgi:hypothetical protein